MMYICIKEKLLDKYECNPLLLNISLMVCSWCKKMQNEDYEISDNNKYQMMFCESLFCTMKQSEEIIMRMLDIHQLERIQSKFIIDKKCDKHINKFMKIVKKVQNEKNKKAIIELNEFYGIMSEFTFLEVVKRLVFYSEFSFAERIILDYFMNNVGILSSTFRKRFYFRPKKSDEVKAIVISPNGAKYQYFNCEPFFDIGWALDEGRTESDTQQIIKSISDDYQFNTQYFFEVKFFNRLMTVFDALDEDKKRNIRGRIAFENYATTLVFNLMKYSDDKCDFYNLHYYSDNQKWKEANLLLNKILVSDIDVDSL